MRTEESRAYIRWCSLGAVGGILMAAGDWLLGCIPIQASDTGMFHRAYYLSGTYGLWRPALIVGLGAVGVFLYYFMVQALNADIDAKYRKTKRVQYLCGIFTAVTALAIHLWSATLAWFTAAQDMFETIFKDYKQEKDVHISGLLADLMNQKPVTEADFAALEGKILLILPDQDFFSGKMQEDLIKLMHDPQIAYVSGGHLSTVLKADGYIRTIRSFLNTAGDRL